MIKMKSLLCEWTGESWTSCRQWGAHHSKFMSGEGGAKISISSTSTSFKLSYQGPSSGISIAHANGSSGDTLHQLFNVLICELNPRLAQKNVKPDIDSITSTCTKSDDKYNMSITVPLMSSDRAWQLNHRGGWRKSDPGDAEVKSLSVYNKALREGPARHVTQVPGGNSIYTYFITYPL